MLVLATYGAMNDFMTPGESQKIETVSHGVANSSET